MWVIKYIYFNQIRERELQDIKQQHKNGVHPNNKIQTKNAVKIQRMIQRTEQ